MQQACPHTIAVFNDKVVGFALSMTQQFEDEIALLKLMFLEISEHVSDKNYIAMGQICIDKDFRKQGIFKGLYQFMVKMVTEYKFTSIITEIDTQNQRSLNAHEAVGFKKLADYPADDKIWRIVILKV